MTEVCLVPSEMLKIALVPSQNSWRLGDGSAKHLPLKPKNLKWIPTTHLQDPDAVAGTYNHPETNKMLPRAYWLAILL